MSASLLFIVGGVPSSSYYKSEVVDLSGQKRTCSAIVDYKVIAISTGAFIGGSAMVCGGESSAKRDKCYVWRNSSGSQSWDHTVTLNTGRTSLASVVYNATHYWITGGVDLDGTILISTELYDVNSNTFSYFVDLPIGRGFHTMFKVNSNHIMMLGNQLPTNRAWLFDQISEEWTELPNSIEMREHARAGLVTFENGTKIAMIAGGDNTKTVEGFNLQDETWTAAVIPDLPTPDDLDYAAAVQFENTFLLVGGHAYVELATIIKYDVGMENWVIMEEKMQTPRYSFAAFLVPDDYVHCT